MKVGHTGWNKYTESCSTSKKYGIRVFLYDKRGQTAWCGSWDSKFRWVILILLWKNLFYPAKVRIIRSRWQIGKDYGRLMMINIPFFYFYVFPYLIFEMLQYMICMVNCVQHTAHIPFYIKTINDDWKMTLFFSFARKYSTEETKWDVAYPVEIVSLTFLPFIRLCPFLWFYHLRVGTSSYYLFKFACFSLSEVCFTFLIVFFRIRNMGFSNFMT